VTDFLDETHKEITSRLKELKPLVDEYNRLEAAASALAKVIGSAASEATSAAVATVRSRRRGRGRPRGSRSAGHASKATPTTAAADSPAATPVKATRKKRGRPPGRKKVGRPPGRPKVRGVRPKGGGMRAAQALSLVRGQPGITIPELAAKMGIKENYLYRVLPGLAQDGKLEKKGRGWYPSEA
jgi:hypothetical protein